MTATSTETPLETLGRENEVSEHLLERLAQAGAQLKAGEDVPSGEIVSGLRLLEQYQRLHARQMDEGLLPEARPVAMTGCFEHLDRMVRDHAEDAARVDHLLHQLGDASTVPPERRAEVGKGLEELASRIYEDLHHESDYPLSCLVPTLSDEAVDRLAAKFVADQEPLADLDGHIDRYLAEPSGHTGGVLAVACVRPGCGARSEARVVPARDGRVGIEPPSGWTAAPGAPHLVPGGKVRLRVEFSCPQHAGGTAGGSAAVEPRGTADPPRPAGAHGASCCDPIEPRYIR